MVSDPGNRGFALAASMMVLALLSVLGAAAVQNTSLEVKISAHDRDARVARYAAEAGLEEARYYVARGWGKILGGPGTATVATAVPLPPGFSWDGNRYLGFALVDQRGARFTVTGHDDTAFPTITLASGQPTDGRFLLIREDFGAMWDGSSLVVDPADWSPAPAGSDLWQGWLLWNAAGESYQVQGSGVTFAGEVRLDLTSDPGAGPFTLSLNPWLAALASGVSPPEDANPGTAGEWDRSFAVGDAVVSAVRATSGSYRDSYRVWSAGTVGSSRAEAAMRVYRAGRSDQRIADWEVR